MLAWLTCQTWFSWQTTTYTLPNALRWNSWTYKKNTSLTPCMIVGVQSWKAALESQWLKIRLISAEFLLFREGEFISYTSGSLTSSLSCLLQCKKTNVEEINPKIVAATVDESQDSVQNNHMHQNNNLPLNFFILLWGFYLNHSVFITLPSTVCVTVTKCNTFSLSS